MKKTIYSLLLLLLTVSLSAQPVAIDGLLNEIEQNSSTLSALREQMETQKLGNKTDIYLPGPEVEFAYLWGKPSVLGNETDISVSQSFDFPSTYVYRSKIAGLENQHVELQYKAERMDLLLHAQRLLIQLAYYNALAQEYDTRLDNAHRIASSYDARYKQGDTNIIEKNKSQVNLTTVENERNQIEIEQQALRKQLQALNGGLPIEFSATAVMPTLLPASFDEWLTLAEAQSPALQYLSKQIDISKQQIKLNRSLNLPKFSAGYASEKIGGEHFQGVAIGMSIPLWENKNKVRQAKAQLRSAEAMLHDGKIQFYNHLQHLYLKTQGLQQNADKYRQILQSHNNESLLKKSLDMGEISLLTYLLEAEYYYDTVNRALEAERDYLLTMAELSAVML